MKKLVLLLLLLAVPVYAINMVNKDFVGQVSRDQFVSVTCEREKKLGANPAFQDRVCCVNLNKNRYCENDEPVLGTCLANTCLWPSDSYKPWYSWRYKSFSCPYFAIMAGKEYEELLKWSGCEKKDFYWCCGTSAFPTFEGKTITVEPKPVSKTPTGGALLVLDAAKWRSLELGGFKYLKPEQRALSTEKQRCSNGGKAVKILDKKYGSFFADTRNLKPGMRAFYMTEKEVIPLISWC